MATMPADPTADQAAPEQEEPTSGGLTIEIKVAADGSISVGVEPEGQEAAEEGGEGGEGESDMQPVASLPELFKLIKQIIAQGGAPAPEDESEMTEGYNSRV